MHSFSGNCAQFGLRVIVHAELRHCRQIQRREIGHGCIKDQGREERTRRRGVIAVAIVQYQLRMPQLREIKGLRNRRDARSLLTRDRDMQIKDALGFRDVFARPFGK